MPRLVACAFLGSESSGFIRFSKGRRALGLRSTGGEKAARKNMQEGPLHPSDVPHVAELLPDLAIPLSSEQLENGSEGIIPILTDCCVCDYGI